MESFERDPHFAAITDALSEGFLFLDMSCRVIYANQAFVRMTGYKEDTLAGRDVAGVAGLIFEPEVAAWFMARMDQVRKGEVQEREPASIVAKAGHKVPVMCSVNLVRNDKGIPIAVIVALEDISVSRKVEQELRNANVLLSKALADLKRIQQQVIHSERLNAVGQMTSGIAHDFNNSLMPILGFSELLIKRPHLMDDRAEALSMLKDIHAAAKDASATIRRLRDFYRQPEDTGRIPVSLNQMAESVVALTQPSWRGMAGSRGITIDIQQKLEEIPPISAHESQVREVLTNLMLNAIDALPKGGTITISTWADQDWARITIADTGEGMATDVKCRIFEPFFTTKGVRGTGMGLVVARGIVRQHGGRIEFRSEMGQGTAFDLYFPLKRADQTIYEPAKKGRVHPDILRVLCIDDEQWSRDVMKRFLAYEGHTVVLTASGSEGLREFGKGQFDLIIVDRAMPDMSGDEVAIKIKNARPDMPILLVTGFGEVMKDTGESPVGIDAILSKPVSHEELHDAIAKLMGD